MVVRPRIILIALFLVLAACSSTQPPASPTPASVSPPPATSTGPIFSVQLTGDITSTLASGTDTIEFLKTTNGTTGYTLSFIKGDGELTTQLLFYTSNLPAVGSYTFSQDAVDGAVTGAVYDQSGDTRAFTLAVGQLTLQQTGDTYSGTFDFVSQGGKPGSQDQTVRVHGTFQNISLKG